MLAGNGIPVGVCIRCLLDCIRNAKQHLGLALIGAARQKQCQTDNGKVSFPAQKQGLPRLRDYNTFGNCGHRAPHGSFMSRAIFFGQFSSSSQSMSWPVAQKGLRSVRTKGRINN
jgi:hypothetical protein